MGKGFGPEKSGMVFFAKALFFLAITGISGFYFLNFPVPPEGPSQALVQQMMRTQATPVLAMIQTSGPLPSDLPVLEPAAGSDITAAPPPSAEDPLAWDSSAPAPSTAPAVTAPSIGLPPPAGAESVATAQQAPEAAPPVPAPVAIAAPVGQGASSEDKIGVLEKRLAELEMTLAELQSKAVTKQDIEALEQKMQSAAVEKKPSEQKAPAKKSSARKTVKKKVTAPAAAEPKWVLKSAKPGMAWVSQVGSSELRTVSVGETLPGVGKVTAVVKDSTGRWVVSGTKNYISQ